jgi:hypothetical protein
LVDTKSIKEIVEFGTKQGNHSSFCYLSLRAKVICWGVSLPLL